MTDNGLKTWGFRAIPTDDSRIIKFEGLKIPENTMISYEIFPGVIIMYIRLLKKYQSKNSKSKKSSSGLRIGYCAEGNYFTYINDSKVLITTNEIFVGKYYPYSKHNYTSSHNTRAFNIVINDKKIESANYSCPFINSFLKIFKNVKDYGLVINDESLIKLANELIIILESRDFDYISLKTLEFIYRLSLINDKNFTSLYCKVDKGEILTKIEEYMVANIQKDIDLNEICQKFQISKSNLNLRFTRKFQYSPMKYLAKLRLIKAEDYLINTDKTITEIALDLTYASSSNFTRAFKAFTGLSPSDYRKKNKS